MAASAPADPSPGLRRGSRQRAKTAPTRPDLLSTGEHRATAAPRLPCTGLPVDAPGGDPAPGGPRSQPPRPGRPSGLRQGAGPRRPGADGGRARQPPTRDPRVGRGIRRLRSPLRIGRRDAPAGLPPGHGRSTSFPRSISSTRAAESSPGPTCWWPAPGTCTSTTGPATAPRPAPFRSSSGESPGPGGLRTSGLHAGRPAEPRGCRDARAGSRAAPEPPATPTAPVARDGRPLGVLPCRAGAGCSTAGDAPWVSPIGHEPQLRGAHLCGWGPNRSKWGRAAVMAGRPRDRSGSRVLPAACPSAA